MTEWALSEVRFDSLQMVIERANLPSGRAAESAGYRIDRGARGLSHENDMEDPVVYRIPSPVRD